MVDHDHALAERLDVGHVVARQEHGRLVALVVLGDERPDPLLHRHVEPDRGLVEEEHLRPVQERADDLHLHPLAERELAHRLADEVADVEQLDQVVAQLQELGPRDPVDRPVQLERVERGQVPLELVAIPHHERDPAEEVALALGRHMAEDASLARGRVEQAGEHLQRRRLAGAVRAEEADDLTRLDLERDHVDRTHLAVLATDEALDGSTEPRLPLGDEECLVEVGDADGGVGHRREPR